jgi:protein-S-isoprenylcysteine O-methyltransferase
MDPINILVGLNVVATFGAHYSGTKRDFRAKVGAAKEKPKSYLQTVPVYLSTLTLIGIILGVFQVGTLEYLSSYDPVRITGLFFFLVFSWIQVLSVKTLAESYSQEVLIHKDHVLITSGIFRFVRHPQYLAQMLMDLGAAAALLSYIVIPFVIIEIPLLIMRAMMEEKLLEKYFKDEYKEYKKKSGFFIPFIG